LRARNAAHVSIIFGCHGQELEQFLSNSSCAWHHGVEGLDNMDSNVSDPAEFGEVEESVSLGCLIKKTLELHKSSVYKEASEPEEPPEEF
jgi:hypothetical protein